jgi:hypothetical protein
MTYLLSLLNNNYGDDSNTTLLKIKTPTCKSLTNTSYKIISYNKQYLTTELISTYGIYRSIILNDEDELVSFSPPKSIDYNLFTTKYPKTDEIIANEFIEGTMINMFWNRKIFPNGGWEIATKNVVGADTAFYDKSKSFREMFFEAAEYNNFNVDLLNKNCCFSFVLQHPDNRIVVKFNKPQLYLVSAYSFMIDNNNSNNMIVKQHDLNIIEKYLKSTTNIKFPQLYTWDNYKSLENDFGSLNSNYEILGVMIHNISTGERTKIRNPCYESIRKLKGNQTKLQYQYLTLRQLGKIKDFLTYYPENKKQFLQFRDNLHEFTNTLHKNYISCYVKKEKQLINYGPQFRTHMYNLHQKYIDDLREKKHFLTKIIVIDYINKLAVPLLMSNLNYQMNRHTINDSIQ